MKHNHNSARRLVSRVSFRGISLILALGLLLESCHGTDHPLVSGSKIHQYTKVKLPIKQRGSREEILQEQEDQLLGKAFKTRQGYIVKFYKEEGLWRANIAEEIGIFRNEFDLPAYLGEDEDLAENIERLLFNVDKFDQVQTKLIQVVLSSKEREGYVCIEGGWGGMKKQGSDKKKTEEEGGEKEKEKEKGESSKVLPQATPKKKKRKRRKSSLASGVSMTLPMTLPSTPIQSPTKKPKIQEESSKNKGKEIIEVGKETGSQEVSQPSPKKKKRKRKRRSSLSLVTSPMLSSTPAHSPAKKLKEESESTKVSHTFKKYTIKGSEKKSEGKGKEKMTQEDEEKRLNEDPEFQRRQGKQAYYAWRYEGKNSDRNEALKWLRRAEAQGHEKARKLLEKLERKIIRLKDDQERHIKQGIKKKPISSGAGSSMLQGKMNKLVVPTSKGKTRTGFRDKGWFTNEALNAQLPVGYQLGAACDDGDCFFDALAQCLNRIQNTTKHTVKSLREACYKFYQKNKKLVADWDLKVFEFNLRHQTQGKQGKILGTLRPLLSEHRLIIDRQALRSDFESIPIEDLSYKFFYQLMTIVENNKSSKKYFDGNNPAHDDRVDVVVDAIRYLQERKDKRAKFDTILKELQDKAEKGDGEAQLELGKRYKDGLGVEADLKKAQEWLSKAADQGNAEALYNLGEIYRNGLVINIRNNRAFKFYQLAAKRAYAPAEYILAKMYQEGFGKLAKKVTQAEIFRLFSAAAENGHSEAAYELGKLYQSGLGEIKKDLYKAFTQYEKAAKLGHAAAAYVLAKMCQNGFEEIKMDPAQAFKWYLIAAENGHQEAQLEVADKYYEGREVDRNYQEAVRWYNEAAYHGETGAFYKLARMYYIGQGVDKNDKQALSWYLKAAKQRNAEAQLEVGKFYQNGWGLEKPNLAKAKKWYKKAAVQGKGEAFYNLGLLCEKEEKYEKAYKWYEKSAEKGYTKANIKLGWMHHNGLGVEKNIDIALYYYKKGAE